MEANKATAGIENLILSLTGAILQRVDTLHLGSSMVACYNFTGTPYVKNEVLPEVVYSYSLKDAINNGYLKTLRLHKFANTSDREFARAVVDDFLERFDGRTLEGMQPKLVFFSPTIANATGYLRPLLEEELVRRDIPVSQLLVNVGDPKVTSNDDIRAFNELDCVGSEKLFLILVSKGKEGWNCCSLCGVAMFRQPKSRVFVLQASMRSLRSIGDRQEEGQVYLTAENAEVFNEELQQNFRLTTDDLLPPERDSKKYEVRVLKKRIFLMCVRHLYDFKEKEPAAPSFDMENWDVERYRILHIEEKMVLQPGVRRTQETPTDIYIKEQRIWSVYTLVAEIACYLCASQLKIEGLLRKSAEEGLEALVAKVNEFKNCSMARSFLGCLTCSTRSLIRTSRSMWRWSLSATRQAAFLRFTAIRKRRSVFGNDRPMPQKARWPARASTLIPAASTSCRGQDFFLNHAQGQRIRYHMIPHTEACVWCG